MTGKQIVGLTVGVIIAISALAYVCMTPYNRMRATEILGDDRLPLLEAYAAKHGMSMDVGPSGGVIQGQAEPLRTWEVFFWTPR